MGWVVGCSGPTVPWTDGRTSDFACRLAAGCPRARMSDVGRENGPWEGKRIEIGRYQKPIKTCGLCEHWFEKDNLTGVTTRKAILQKQAEWGLTSSERKLREFKPSRLYEMVQVCIWCAHVLNPGDGDEDEGDITGYSGGAMGR